MKALLIAVLAAAAVRAASADALTAADEGAALKFLDFVTGPLSPAEEKEWWDIGGRQFGVFARRYHIAFAGYAAAALGMRGDAEATNATARVLSNCIGRYLRRDIWSYTQAKSYWGEKPWAPDPCYRENVMYTGHLLQLLAFYEWFSHDRRYHDGGFDFVWSKEKKVRYTVEKLIGVTVDQIRESTCGGITCEPGLVFFPCNNHPHVALTLFGKMGYGNWKPETRKWERWALDNFTGPLFGGGAINLVYHRKSGLFYPRGSSGLDGWSLLWYEAWADDRRSATDLWKKAAAKIDWRKFTAPADVKGGKGCLDPEPVPPSVAAAFLAAAARVCDDAETAMRLEKAVDTAYLVRKDGKVWLDLKRDWRIGATAMRIAALAIAGGSSYRELVR